MVHAARHVTPRPTAAERRARRCGAFTLVEVIVVIVILAVLSSVLVLKVSNTGARQADAESQAVQRLLTIAAERDAASPQPQAIEFDESTRELRLLNQRTTESRDGRSLNEWIADPILPPVVLTRSRLSQAWLDGRPLPRSRWRIPFSASQLRPGLVLEIEPGDAEPRGSSSGRRESGGGAETEGAGWRVALGPDDPAASRVSLKSARGSPVFAAPRAIDLDAAGKGAKPW